MKGMPNIPNFKGLATAGQTAGLSLGGAVLINKVFGNYWGVFNEYGIPIILADNVISLKSSQSAQISSAPLEKGSFASYNKVDTPDQIAVQMSKGSGGTLERGVFLAQITALKKSTLLFHVVCPEAVYMNMSLVQADSTREAKEGAQLIKVNMYLEEVREITVRYDSVEVKNPADAKTKDSGQVQPKDASQNKSLGVMAVEAFKSWF